MTDLDTTVLSPRQEQAMLLLLSGGTQRDAAALCGVSEFTVSRWLNTDATFRKLYEHRRLAVRQAYEAKIVQTAGNALQMLDKLISLGEDHTRMEGIKVALKVAGLLPVGTRVTAFGSQVNVGDQQVNIGENNV